MFVRIATVTLMAFIATAKGDDVWTGLTAKWSTNSSDGYWDLPQTLTDAEAQGWTEITGAELGDDVAVRGYCGDPRVSLLYSTDTGDVIGLQIAFLVSDMEADALPFSYDDNRAIIKKTLDGVEYYTATSYFSNNEETGTRQIFAQEKDEMVELPTEPDAILATGTYFLNLCVQWMGVHYYPINATTDCSNLYPWLLIKVNDHVVSYAFLGLGASSNGAERTWFETIDDPATAIPKTIPSAPSCLAEYALQYGYMIFHIYLISNPLDIICTEDYVAVYNTTSYDVKVIDVSNRAK